MIVAAKIGDRISLLGIAEGRTIILNDASDLFYREGAVRWFEGKRIENPNTHGTGCTLSSAIASNLAKDFRWRQRYRGQRNIFPAHWRRCLIWEKEVVR